MAAALGSVDRARNGALFEPRVVGAVARLEWGLVRIP